MEVPTQAFLLLRFLQRPTLNFFARLKLNNEELKAGVMAKKEKIEKTGYEGYNA